MPYPNFHAARIKDPGLFARIRVLQTLPNGIMIYGGPLKSDPTGSGKPQAYRFPRKKFTVAQAKSWLKEHNIKFISFEKATGTDAMDSVNRFDVMDETEFWLTKSFKRNGEGFLTGDAIVTNIGVFTYKFKDGSILKELRPPEEVLNSDSLATLKMKPITNNHPKILIDIDNIKDHQVGTTGSNVYTDAYAVAIPIAIQEREAINDVENGKVSLSCGYKADLDYTPGIWGGIEYDAIQRNIRYNHVAIVDRSRAGDLTKIRLDDNDAILVEEEHNEDSFSIDFSDKNTNDGGKNMSDNLKRIKLDDGVEYQADAEVIRALTAANKNLKRLDQVEKDFEKFKTDSQKKASETQANLDTANDKLKAANEEIEKLKKSTMSDEAIQKAIDERLEIVDHAVKAKIEVKKEMTNADIKKAVIMKVFPNAKLDEKDEIYINARFDSAIDVLAEQPHKDNTIKVFSSNPNIHQKRETETVNVDDAYAKYIERLENNYKEGGK